MHAMALRAFPVLYARDVEGVAGFYGRLGFEEYARLPGADGEPGFIGLRRDAAELAVTTEDSPRVLAGVEPGPGPRHELFVYVGDVDATVAELREAGAAVLRDPADMPWGERVAFLQDPEGNVVTLAAAAG
jgi:lactoylglutathione lyase